MDVSNGRFRIPASWVFGSMAVLICSDIIGAPGFDPPRSLLHPIDVPVRCVTGPDLSSARAVRTGSAPMTRTWESQPSVVRRDGTETFVLVVTTSDPVRKVRLELYPPILAISGQRQLTLSPQDGHEDGVFVSEPLRYDPSFPSPSTFRHDPHSPPGISYVTVGVVRMEETNGATNQFLILPAVGLVAPGLALPPTRRLSDQLMASPYLLNVSSRERCSQKQLRLLDFDLHQLTGQIYEHLPDDFDFLVFFSVDHLELAPATEANNYNAGLHQNIRVNYTGTGQTPFDHSELYGSQGRLLGLNIIDTLERGIYSQNLTHELSHQWGVFVQASLGLNEGGAHYKPRSSAASLLGGIEFTEAAPGVFTLNCEQGRAQAREAPPLDKYLMGLVDGAAVPPLKVYSDDLPAPFFICGQAISNLEATVTIEDIQRIHGVRHPGPSTAQRTFAIGFVVETYCRFLSSSELIFYHLLADFYTRPESAAHDRPSQGFNWVSVNNYFQEGTTWKSELTALTTPRFIQSELLPDTSRRLTGVGFPRLEYVLEVSTNLTQWSEVSSSVADAAGRFEFLDAVPHPPAPLFYRLARPTWRSR